MTAGSVAQSRIASHKFHETFRDKVRDWGVARRMASHAPYRGATRATPAAASGS